MAPAKATTFFITPTWDPSIANDPNAAVIEATINAAISVYESVITTPITVNIRFQEVGSGLGQNATFYNTVSYSTYLAALTSHATSADDATALANLPVSLTSIPGMASNAVVGLMTANIRALGLSGGNVATDSTIGLNTSIMNLSRSGAQDPNKYDLMSVVMHEIDEVLAFGSTLNGLAQGAAAPTDVIFPTDLFRFVTGSTVRSFNTNVATQSSFSIDGGHTDLVSFNQNAGGDFADYANGTPMIQNAFGTPGAQPNLSSVELTELDVIGYSLVSTPEPSTIGLIGFSLMAMWKFRRHPATTPAA